jgi:predicted membrane-bound spermidine synthase
MTLCIAFFASGWAALLFETLWFRQAGLLLGNSVWASSLVLAAFMAGLGAGNAWAARFGGRIRRPLLAYAGIEFFVGVTGYGLVLAFPFLPSLLTPLLRAFAWSPASLNLARMAFAFALMVVPSAAMGATLPLLLRALSVKEPVFGRALGRLYGWNTLGAVVGAVAGETMLIPFLGVQGAGALAGLLNLMAGTLAVFCGLRVLSDPTPEEREAPRPLDAPAARLLLAAFLGGGAFLALEVVWFRLLLLFVYGTSRTFAVMLSLVLLGIALGSLTASHWLRLRPEAHRLAFLAAAAAGAAVVLTYAGFSGTLDPRLGLVVDEWAIVRLSLVLMLPVSWLSGMLFTLLGQSLKTVVEDQARAAGSLTLANTAGAAVGALSGSLVFLPRLGIERSLFALAIVYGGIGLLLLRPPEGGLPPIRSRNLLLGAAAIAYAVVVALFPFGLMQNHFLKRIVSAYTSDGSRLIAFRETVTETLMYTRSELAGRPVAHRLITNGFSMSATGMLAGRYMALFVHWGVALNPQARRALLISYGVGTTAQALVETRSLESIDVVDISKDILEMGRLVFPGRPYPLDDPRVHVHVEDGRFFLLTTDRRFDLITAEPPPPKYAGIVNLYSLEYFHLLRDRLAEGGVATYWLPVYQMASHEARAISAAFCDAFPDCSLWTGAGPEWMLAGTRNAKGPLGEAAFSRQWLDPKAGPLLRDRGIESPEQLGALFIADGAELQAWIDGAKPLDDDHPGRLSHRHVALGEPSSQEYWTMMDPDRCRERFLRSPFVRRMWPEGLRERTLPFFESQKIINKTLSEVYGMGTPVGIGDLESTLTGTTLRTPVLWLMGSDADHQRAAAEARGQGIREPILQEIQGIGAMADRDYRGAAEFLGRAEPFAAHGDRLRRYRILALEIAGERERAAQLLESAGAWTRKPGADLSEWTFLAARLGLPNPAAH